MENTTLDSTLKNAKRAILLAVAAIVSFAASACEFHGHGHLDDDLEIRIEDDHDGHDHHDHHDGHRRR